MQQYIDLTTLADRLGSDRRYGRFVNLVRRCDALASISLDLKAAENSLDLLSEVMTETHTAAAPQTNPNQTGKAALTGSALFNNAVISYSRAMHSRPIDRFKFCFLDSYTTEQKAIHRRTAKIRDQVIAHFGRGSAETGGGWVEERIVLRLAGEIASFSNPNKRYNYKAQDALALQSIARRALEIAGEKRDADQLLLLRETERLMSSEAHFAAAFGTCLFDPAAFFESSTVARDGFIKGLNAVQHNATLRGIGEADTLNTIPDEVLNDPSGSVSLSNPSSA